MTQEATSTDLPAPAKETNTSAKPLLPAPEVSDSNAVSQTTAPGPPSTARMVGIDLARGLAVLGMYAAHFGPDPTIGGPLGFAMELARGRSATLFALLAGFSLVLITGRPQPRTGRAGRQAVGRIVIRSLVLIPLGYALTALGTEIEVILSFYGLLFLAVLPLYRLRARTLAVIAAVGALIMPQVLYVIRQSIDNGERADTVIAYDPVARLSGTDGLIELLFSGAYPVLTWAPSLVAGMAVARLDLTQARIRTRLALTGLALAVLGFGGSWLALHLVPNAHATIAAATDGDSGATAWWSDTVGYPTDGTPAAWLLVGVPHSQTTFSVLGCAGVALAVVAATERLPRFTRLTAPISAVGMTALTAYVLHILAIYVVGMEDEA